MLCDRVNHFIAQPHTGGLPDLLSACVQDGSTETLLQVRRLFVEVRNDAFTTPEIAWALACWGEAGLDQLVAATQKVSTSKTSRMCLTVLCTVSANSLDRRGLLWCSDRLRPVVLDIYGANSSLAEYARTKLIEFVLAFDDDDELLDHIHSAFSFVSYPGPDVAKELIAVLSARWLAISTPLLDKYERLIADHPSEEPVFQQFFTEHPQILDPMAAEVWPLPDLHGYRQPDFVLRRFDNTYVVVEIEAPSKLLVTRKNAIAASASTAVSQVNEYLRFIRQLRDVQIHFPSLDDVRGLAVVGLQSGLDAHRMQALRNHNAGSHALRTVGFDWLADRARAVQGNFIRAGIPVRTKKRVV